jgi:hypothetical protein
MKAALLLGAGFSSCWDGLLAEEVYGALLDTPTLRGNQRLLDWMRGWNERGMGFEDVLTMARIERPDDARSIEAAIVAAFAPMNDAYRGGELRFPHEVTQWLAKFDIIFTLNQDVLLVAGYALQEHTLVATPQRWAGVAFPHIVPAPHNRRGHFAGHALAWDCTVNMDALPHPRAQQILKLHGSTNWTDGVGNNLVVMGANKPAQIQNSELLRSYDRQFEEFLMDPKGTRLMVSGYSFRDTNINEVLERSATNERLEIWLNNPAGANVFRKPGTEHAIGGPQFWFGDAVRSCVRGTVTRSIVDTLTVDRVAGAQLRGFRFSFED